MKRNKIIWLVITFCFLNNMVAQDLPTRGDSLVRKSIYPEFMSQRSTFYNRLWGKHYRNIYCTPIRVPSITFDKFLGGVNTVTQADDFNGLVIEDKQKRLFLVKPLGGSTSFLESDFFQEMYNRNDFSGTYLNSFIGDAYTIINPYSFLASEYMARSSGLPTTPSQIYYIPDGIRQDTVTGGVALQNKMVHISRIPDIHIRENILLTDEMLKTIKSSHQYNVDKELYIRSRLFDMLIGDWNKVPENWNWQGNQKDDKYVYTPIVIDRTHAFTKVDGMFLQTMLNVLGLNFIVNYDATNKKLKKSNSLGFALDMALVGGCDESLWVSQAQYLQGQLTDKVIDKAFSLLPPEIAEQETGEIRSKLEKRRELLPDIARRYVRLLQRTPVIAGTQQSDSIIVERFDTDSLRIRMYDQASKELYFDNAYNKKNTSLIWIYGMDGDDTYEVTGNAEKPLPVYLISGKGDNTYSIQSEEKLRVYGYKDEKEKLSAFKDVHVHLSDSDNIHKYDYTKIKYHTTAFTPAGVYDSDYGTSMAVYFTYTMYAFKRSPFTYQHRVGYNFLRGFYYQGIFPGYNPRMSFNIDAFLGNPQNFNNFFGFGNSTQGYKDENKKYNRVFVREYTITPSFQYALTQREKISLSLGFHSHKAKWENDRLITDYYQPDDPIFNTNYFLDMKGSITSSRYITSYLPRIESSLSAGWVMNLKKASRNFPYLAASLALDFQLSRRLILATQFNAKALFRDTYEFYQSASIDLRGFRDNRFIGKQAFYQFTDLRLDMGKLENPFTPIRYGVFVGFDHGRVWYPREYSSDWHTSYGAGFWLTFINKLTTKYSYFGSSDSFRFTFGLSLDF